MYKQMIYDLLKLLEEKHLDCYFNISKEETSKYIEGLLDNNDLNDEYDFYYFGNKLIKKMFSVYDSHTKVMFKNASPYNFPIRLKLIDNKLYIAKINDEHKDFLFSQILKINDIDINQLINELDEIVPYSTKEFFESEIERVFFNGKKIKSLPSMKEYRSVDEFKYIVLKDGQIKEMNLNYSNQKFNNKENINYEINNDTIVIHYNICKEDYEEQMKEFVKTIEEEAKKNNIENYIVDIRDNMGGNSYIIKPLIEYLKDKKVITLTGKDTFSAGRFALVDLINIGSITVGTGIGTSINCFGNSPRDEIGDNFFIPISNKYFYFEDNHLKGIDNKEQFKKLKEDSEYSFIFNPIIFKPDYYVENSIEDIKNGYDRQLHSAKLLINKKLNNNRKDEFLKLKTPEELMKFLDDNMTYGWLDSNNQKHINTLSHVREKYRTSSVEEILDSGLYTCIESAKLIKLFFDKIGLENKLYCHRTYEDEDNFDKSIKMHCFVLFKKDDHWYHFEHSMTPIKGIHKYESVEEALDNITSKWDKNERQLVEIDNIPDGLSFKEFNQYVNQFDKNKVK